MRFKWTVDKSVERLRADRERYELLHPDGRDEEGELGISGLWGSWDVMADSVSVHDGCLVFHDSAGVTEVVPAGSWRGAWRRRD